MALVNVASLIYFPQQSLHNHITGNRKILFYDSDLDDSVLLIHFDYAWTMITAFRCLENISLIYLEIDIPGNKVAARLSQACVVVLFTSGYTLSCNTNLGLQDKLLMLESC